MQQSSFPQNLILSQDTYITFKNKPTKGMSPLASCVNVQNNLINIRVIQLISPLISIPTYK